MPCIENFTKRTKKNRESILGQAPLIVVEAGLSLGWRTYFDSLSHVVSVETFGSSAPKDDLYKHFKITKENIVSKALKIINK